VNPQSLPFTREAFIAMFATYNEAIWPLQILAYALAIVSVVLAIKPFVRWSDRLVAAILAAFWLWIGAVFFIRYQRVLDQSPISTIATLGFLIEGVLFFWFGLVRRELTSRQAGTFSASRAGH
jgi:predicted tellurium resistance membrane protein TerC